MFYKQIVTLNPLIFQTSSYKGVITLNNTYKNFDNKHLFYCVDRVLGVPHLSIAEKMRSDPAMR